MLNSYRKKRGGVITWALEAQEMGSLGGSGRSRVALEALEAAWRYRRSARILGGRGLAAKEINPKKQARSAKFWRMEQPEQSRRKDGRGVHYG